MKKDIKEVNENMPHSLLVRDVNVNRDNTYHISSDFEPQLINVVDDNHYLTKYYLIRQERLLFVVAKYLDKSKDRFDSFEIFQLEPKALADIMTI